MKLHYVITAAIILSVTALVAGHKNKGHKARGPHVNPRAQIRGTSIYHLSISKSMVYVPDPTVTNAVPIRARYLPSGSVSTHHNQQGNADNQRLDVSLGRLQAYTNYMLLALVGDETNYTYVTDMQTNRRGKSSVRFQQIGSSRGHGLGHQKDALPDFLDPIDNIREMAVANTSTQLVLRADLTMPDRISYLIKKNMTNDGVETNAIAAMDIKANHRRTWFCLDAGGLQTNSTYYLALNGEVNQQGTTDQYGDLAIRSWNIYPTNVLSIRTIALWNQTSNSVLSTTLGPQ